MTGTMFQGLTRGRPAFARPVQGGVSGEYITTPEAHGWDVGNTVAQNTTDFNDAIADANANAGSSSTGRGVVELVQGKTYTVVSSNGGLNNQNGALDMLSNVEIRTAGKPTRASGNQAMIQFESWSGKTDMHNQSIIQIENCTSFLVGWVTIDGNKNSIDSITDVDYTNGSNGGFYAIRITTGGVNGTYREVLAQFSLTDGLGMNEKSGGTIPVGHLFEDCTFTRNRRQGYSAGKSGAPGGGYDQNIWRRCTFSDTGDFAGDVKGQLPAAGVDIEPAGSNEHVIGSTFEDCVFSGNVGSEYHQGVLDTPFRGGKAFTVDMKANFEFAKVIRCQATDNYDNFTLVLWDGPTFDEIQIEDFSISGTISDLDRILIGGHGAGGSTGLVTNCTITNTNAPDGILIQSDLAPSGHSINIWKGDFPGLTVDNSGGLTTVTVNSGFPP